MSKYVLIQILLQTFSGLTPFFNPIMVLLTMALRKVYGTIYLDTSLTAMGGVYGNMVYTLPFPLNYNNYNINHLEMINIMVSLNIWGHIWSNKKININCDNLPVVEVLKTARARDDTLAACACNIWLLTSIYNIQLHVSHIQGAKNTIADLLSRGSTADIKNCTLCCLTMCGYTHSDLCYLIIIFDFFQIRTGGQLSWHPGLVPDCRNHIAQLPSKTMTGDFLAFLVPAELSLSQVDTIQLLACMEFLCHNDLSPSNIANYIRANLVICGLSTIFLQDDRIHLFLRALKINRPLTLKNAIYSY